MPIPAAPLDSSDVPSTLLVLFRQLHDQLRDELRALSDEALNWAPTSGANTIATIDTNLVGSEAETLQCVAGVECVRDRGAEFLVDRLALGQVLDLLSGADGLLDQLQPLIDESRLGATFSLPTLPPEEVRSGVTWLVGNYGHAREHVGQVQLTKQLFLASTEDRRAEVDRVVATVIAWAKTQSNVRAIGLAGSWARGRPSIDSDLDLVVLVTKKHDYVTNADWVPLASGSSGRLVHTKEWGPLTERRIELPSGLEVEYGFAPTDWASIDPVDSGTLRVISDGFQVLYDPDSLLARLVQAIR